VGFFVGRGDGLGLWAVVCERAWALAYLLTGDEEAGAEIVQSTFVSSRSRAWARRDPYALDLWVTRRVVRSAARRDRVERLRRRRRTGDEWTGGAALGFRTRAVLILTHYLSLPPDTVADVLGTSPGGVGAALTRGSNLGTGDEIADRLRAAAAGTDRPAWDPGRVARVSRRMRIRTALTTVLVTAAVAGLSWAGLDRIAGPQPDQTVVEVVPQPRTSELEGYPGWCPSRRGLLRISGRHSSEAVQQSVRLNIALIKGYASTLDHIVARPAGAPPVSRWPSTTSFGIRVVEAGPSAGNDVLTDQCGPRIAARTMTVILESPGFPARDGVAFYWLRRASGLKMWGTFSGSAAD